MGGVLLDELRRAYEARVLQTRDHLGGQRVCLMWVGGSGRGLVGERGIERFSHDARAREKLEASRATDVG